MLVMRFGLGHWAWWKVRAAYVTNTNRSAPDPSSARPSLPLSALMSMALYLYIYC